MYIDINNTTLHYKIYGEQNSEVIICLHGNGDSGNYFRKQVEFFSDKYKVITIDSRGQGKSNWSGEKLSISLISYDIIAFCECMKISKSIFIGFSDGANVIMDMLTKAPDLISKAILNGGNIKYKGLKLSVRMAMKLEYYKLKVSSRYRNHDKKKLAVWSLMMKDIDIEYSNLNDIEVPCLVIVGDKDMISQDESDKIHENLSVSKLIVLEGSHFIASQISDKFNKSVTDFLNDTI